MNLSERQPLSPEQKILEAASQMAQHANPVDIWASQSTEIGMLYPICTVGNVVMLCGPRSCGKPSLAVDTSTSSMRIETGRGLK